ncbi:MAG TPA: META domain-containing protein [Shinella sp.]|uniref:META domain-containing protein n=1 Tax=Shinella sp. TaxID=1870904 RepID=UPI0029ABC48F|nr:META domain-containing protein [Shinella sp.]MDX3978361.1 META domain-containing protein [Shinella sp.]HEV7248355.1 META domain-containing protein [Shinella sp.]
MHRRLRVWTLACLAFLAAAPAYADEPVPGGLGGSWLAEDIGGNGVIDDLQTTLEIKPDGNYGGNGGCNTYRGKLKVQNGNIAFAPAAATRKMCAPAIMDQEQKFFDALGTVTSWKLENGILHLTGKEGAPPIRLSALKNNTDIVIRLPGPEQSVARETLNYQCDAEQRVVVEYINVGANSLAVLRVDEETVIAANVMAASGAKYAGGRYEWWTKGDEATLYDLTRGENAPGVTCKKTG